MQVMQVVQVVQAVRAGGSHQRGRPVLFVGAAARSELRPMVQLVIVVTSLPAWVRSRRVIYLGAPGESADSPLKNPVDLQIHPVEKMIVKAGM